MSENRETTRASVRDDAATSNVNTEVPVIAFVGKGDSGKTTFVEKVIRELVASGVRVATVKHHVHDYEIDVPGKDSWRHARAGATTTMVSSPDKFSMIQKVDRERSLAELAQFAADSGCDVLLAEGYKVAGMHRIEVSRLGRSSEPLSSGPEDAIALVTDNPALATLGIPMYSLDDAADIAVLIQTRFLGER